MLKMRLAAFHHLGGHIGGGLLTYFAHYLVARAGFELLGRHFTAGELLLVGLLLSLAIWAFRRRRRAY